MRRTLVVWLNVCTGGTAGDRATVATRHLDLLNERYWALATPSSALSVLGVLARSGTSVQGLDRVATQHVGDMTACMTKSEKSVLQRVSSFLSTSRTTSSVSPRESNPEDAAVTQLYAAACSGNRPPKDSLHIVDDSFVRRLSFTSSLLLLEVSLCCQWGREGINEDVLSSLIEHLSSVLTASPKADFKAVWWLLLVSKGDKRQFRRSVNWGVGSRLFNCCVRQVHRLLPELSSEQQILAYLALQDSSPYPQPFIVIGELERQLSSAELFQYSAVPMDLLLRFMCSPLVRQRRVLFAHLCLQWFADDRIRDMSTSECLVAVAVLADLHTVAADEASAVASLDEWEALHDSVFAQLYSHAMCLKLSECVSTLECAEIINLSPIGITTPMTFVERIKNRVWSASKLMISKSEKGRLCTVEIDEALESLLRFRGLMERCTVLPVVESDEDILRKRINTLAQLACQPSSQSSH